MREVKEVLSEGLMECRDISYNNRLGKELLMGIFEPIVEKGADLPVIVNIHAVVCIGRKLVKFDVDFTRIDMVAESALAYLGAYVAAMRSPKAWQEAIGYKPTNMVFRAMGLISGMFYTTRKDMLGRFLSRFIYGKDVRSIAMA